MSRRKRGGEEGMNKYKTSQLFSIHTKLLREFKKVCIDRGIPYSDAVEEAMKKWIKNEAK